MSKPIQLPAILGSVSTLKDGGVAIRFQTQELTADEKSLVFNYQNQFGWLLFKETEHKEDDIKNLELIRRDTRGKSPSQRLRAVLFVLYQQRGDTSISFEIWYEQQLEKFINRIKSELE